MKPSALILRLALFSLVNPAALALVVVVMVELWQERHGKEQSNG